MAHLRKRHLHALLSKTLRFSPIVGLFGHRQVGKTTLCEGLAQNYVTFDRSEVLDQGLYSPEALIRSNIGLPLVIDECQLAPPLFPALKEWVRSHKKPGQFLLTGSVRFSSRKNIRESLTGRIVNWELLPMDLSEAHSAPLPNAIPRLLASKDFNISLTQASYYSAKNLTLALNQGGLPGVFAVRDESVRRQRFETQIETALERDLRLLVQTNLDFRKLRNLLSVLAARQTQPIEFSEVSRTSRISVPALKRLISALEAMFIIRIVETEGSRKHPVLFFEDQGEASHLVGENRDPLMSITRFLFSFVRQQWVYRPDLAGSLFQFRSRGGAFVPLALRTRLGILGFIPMLDEVPGRHELASAQSFLANYKGARCLFIHLGNVDRALGKDMRIVPLSHLV
jgi:predicted AAA+ superfamily ATPase